MSQMTVTVDGYLARNFIADCGEPNCDLVRGMSWKDSAFSAGTHKVVITAYDAVGNLTERQLAVRDDSESTECGVGVYRTSGGQPCEARFDSCTDLRGETVSGSEPEIATDAAEAVVRDSQPSLLAAAGAAAAPGGGSIAPTLRFERDAFEADQNLGSAAISSSPAGGLALGAGPRGVCLLPEGISKSASSASRSGDAVIYPNTESGTDTLVRASAYGLETFKSIRNSAAPETFSWQMELRPGQAVQQLDDHTVAIIEGAARPPGQMTSGSGAFDPADVPDTGAQMKQGAELRDAVTSAAGGTVRTIISAPGAVDADGRSIPTTLRAEGDQLTMTVRHRDAAAYPVIADPHYYQFYVVRATTYNVKGYDKTRALDLWSFPFPSVTIANNLKIAYGQTWTPADYVLALQEQCSERIPEMDGYLTANGLPLTWVFASTRVAFPQDGPFQACSFGIATAYPEQYATSIQPSCVVSKLPRNPSSPCQFETPTTTEQRRLQRVTVMFPQAPLRVMGTHMAEDPRMGTPGAPNYYFSQQEAGGDIFAGDATRNKVILGDFNIGYSGNSCAGSAWTAALAMPSFYNGSLGVAEADPGHNITAYRHDYQDGPHIACAKLDYMFVNSTTTHSGVAVYGFSASDHYALASSLAILKQ